MGLLFAFAVAVQHNDPDPLRWMLIYGAAAAVSLLAAFRPVPPWAPAAPGLVALVWAGTLAPAVLGKAGLADMFRTYRMMSPEMEAGREMLGLAIVTAWMAVLAIRGLTRSK